MVPLLQAESIPSFDVTQYGAVGDGTTDSSAAIRSAIAAARASAAHPSIVFPGGYYRIPKTASFVIDFPAHIVGSSGDFNSGSVIYADSGRSTPIFDFVQGAQGSSVEKLALYSSGALNGASGIHVNIASSTNGNGTTPLRFENLFMAGLYDGISIDNGNTVFMSHLMMANNQNDGIKITKGIGFYIHDSEILGSHNYGLEINGSSGKQADCAAFQLNNTQFQGFGGNGGILMKNMTQFFGQGVSSDTSLNDGIVVLSNTSDIDFVDSWTAGAGCRTLSTGGCSWGGPGHGIYLAGTANFRWTGGFIRGNSKSGVFIDYGNRDVSFDHVGFSANGLMNNKAADSYGILVQQQVGNLRVANSSFGNLGEDLLAPADQQTYGIFFNVNASNGYQPGLQIQGNNYNGNYGLTNAYTSPWMVAGNAFGPNWGVGAGIPAGSCKNGSLFSNAAGKLGSTFYVCVSGAWVNLK